MSHQHNPSDQLRRQARPVRRPLAAQGDRPDERLPVQAGEDRRRLRLAHPRRHRRDLHRPRRSPAHRFPRRRGASGPRRDVCGAARRGAQAVRRGRGAHAPGGALRRAQPPATRAASGRRSTICGSETAPTKKPGSMAGLFRCGSSSIGDVDHHPATLPDRFPCSGAPRSPGRTRIPGRPPASRRSRVSCSMCARALLTDSSLRSRPISG